MGVREGPKTRGAVNLEDMEFVLIQATAPGDSQCNGLMGKACETGQPQWAISQDNLSRQVDPKALGQEIPPISKNHVKNGNYTTKILAGLVALYCLIPYADICGAADKVIPRGPDSGFLYSLTHMSPYAYIVLFMIFILSVINLWRQGYLFQVSGNEYVRPKEFKDPEGIPRNVIDGKVDGISDKTVVAGNGAKENSKNLLSSPESEESVNETYTKRVEVPSLNEVPSRNSKYKSPTVASSYRPNLRVKVNQRVRLDNARFVFGRHGFASAYTREHTLESAENWAASVALMSGGLFGKSLGSLDQVSYGNQWLGGSSSASIKAIDEKGGIIMPPKKATPTKRAPKKKVEKAEPVVESKQQESSESAIVSAPHAKTELTARMSRIDSLIEAAEQGEFSGRVPEIRKEHETRWGKLLDEDISLREQILTLKQKENTLLKMIRDRVADNVLETADVAGQNGLIKTPKA